MDTDHINNYVEEPVSQHSNEHSIFVNEHKLWKSFKEGDLEAYALIYKMYFFVLYQYGKKISNDAELVEDSIQDLFIKIWNNRENLNTTSSIKYYLFTALRRKLLDKLKSSHAKMQSGNDFSQESLLVVEDQEEDEMFEQKEAVLKALNQLSTHQQKLLHLKFYKNLSNKEIAEELGITIQSVYNAVFKTLKSLREQLSIWVISMLFYLFQ